MQGKKQYREKLFLSFRLSERVPKDNFYLRLNSYYDQMQDRLQTAKAKRMKKLRSATVEPVIGTLVTYLGMKRVNTHGLELTNRCILMAAVAYNLKKLMKFTATKVQADVKVIQQNLHNAFFDFLYPISLNRASNNYML